jgi:murein DD-endopeptidase MepM/ murein hydrolase activator NlpD
MLGADGVAGRATTLAVALAGVALVVSCGTAPADAPAGDGSTGRSATAPTTPPDPGAGAADSKPTAHVRPRREPPGSSDRRSDATREARFFVRDRHRYGSPWYGGRHRIMIDFGCTTAPYYDHDPACPGDNGFHHGIDIAMACGTPLSAGTRGTVLSRAAPGALGSAYGPHAFRIRTRGVDIVIGHVRKVYVRPGESITSGQRIARASDAGAPDGCHLHFETRPAGGGYTSATNPRRLLELRR